MGEQEGAIVLAALAPHPPIMVPEVGGPQSQKVGDSIQAMLRLAEEAVAARPEVAVFVSPHGPVFRDAVAVRLVAEVEGSLAEFQAPEVRFRERLDLELGEAIARAAEEEGLPVARLDQQAERRYGFGGRLDHGVMVPLYFLKKQGLDVPLVLLGYGLLPLEDLYAWGAALGRAVAQSQRRVFLVASGDLSHRLEPGAPAGYDPQGRVFDARLRELLAKLDVEGILNLPADLVERAGECGLRSLVMVLGALDGLAVEPEVLSYQGPFGVGYLVAVLRPRGEAVQRRWLVRLRRQRAAQVARARAQESPPVALARRALETYVREGRVLDPPAEWPPELRGRAGVFVSLKKHGQLRGCIGTISPTRENIAREIIAMAVEAGTRDPRFDPVQPSELDQITYSVDVLQPPEPVRGLEELDPRRYGVIVKKGGRRGLLLPDLEGVDTAEEQVAIAKRKAGLDPDEECELERFEVQRYY